MAETLISDSQPKVEDLTEKDKELRLSKSNLTSELLAKECLENLQTLQPVCLCLNPSPELVTRPLDSP